MINQCFYTMTVIKTFEVKRILKVVGKKKCWSGSHGKVTGRASWTTFTSQSTLKAYMFCCHFLFTH